MDDKKPERKQECVQVVVRCRPLSTKEKKEARGNIIGMATELFQVWVPRSSIFCVYGVVEPSTAEAHHC